MPKRQTHPFHFNGQGDSPHWGSKRGLRRLPLVGDPATGKPLVDDNGRVKIVWPSRRRGKRASGLCSGCDRRTRVRYNPRADAWVCRRCGAGGKAVITQLRGADDPETMAIPTRLAAYTGTELPKRLTAQRRDKLVATLTPAQRRRLISKAGGRLEQYRGPARPLGVKARRELAEQAAAAAANRSHP